MVVLTSDEFLRMGLQLVGFDHAYRQQRVCRATNLMRFRAHFGSNPVVYAQIWEDLQMVEDLEDDEGQMDPHFFLMALHFLTCYPTEQEQSSLFKICVKTARHWSWIYARKIQALKDKKVSLALMVSLLMLNI